LSGGLYAVRRQIEEDSMETVVHIFTTYHIIFAVGTIAAVAITAPVVAVLKIRDRRAENRWMNEIPARKVL
jgi:cytochrome bd-type quinol oxidase subunit 1